MALAGCATSSAGETASFAPRAAAGRVGMENDRLPAQVALDDPSEPFGRTYGLRPPARLAGPPTRLSIAEQEALIARAITEHEMRRP